MGNRWEIQEKIPLIIIFNCRIPLFFLLSLFGVIFYTVITDGGEEEKKEEQSQKKTRKIFFLH